MDASTTAGEERTVDGLARAGFAAKGVLYSVVGVLAVQLALGGGGGEDASQQGAINAVSQQPFGRILVFALALGLTGYALFRAVQTFRGTAAANSSLPDWLARITFAVRAVLYGLLSVLAWREAFGVGDEGGGTEESLTATVLAAPGGTWAVMAVGVVIVIVGIVQLREGWTCGFRDHLDFHGVSGGTRRRLEWLGRIGHLARGVVFLVAGGFVAIAAWRHDPETGVGLDAALQEVAAAPYGTVALILLGLGLVLYGCFCGVEARFVRPARAD
ncbi:DUF1206 domain-containing protein [Egicoccus sp. AB-alg6-2]|uniref:DUF1206 domain-containing protein n=1 Tax=Egicoccus sp. AB-alg6-2 TaxID=3242692 RepID=UPI00359D07EF